MMSYKANIQASLMALAAPSVRNFSNKIWYFTHLFVPLQAVNSVMAPKHNAIKLRLIAFTPLDNCLRRRLGVEESLKTSLFR